MGLTHCIMGYVKIKLTGVVLDEVINQAVEQEISIWDVKMQAQSAELSVALKDFRALMGIIRAYKGLIHIETKRGLPFWWLKAKGRKGLMVGVGLFFVLAYTMTSFVWSYEVRGNERFNEMQLVSILQQYGVVPGKSLHNIDYQALEKQLLLEYFDDIGWADISNEGTKIIIKIKEREQLGIGAGSPAHLVARNDGIIKDLLVMQGIAQVQKEQMVHKGDILIAGIAYESREKSEDGTYDWSGQPSVIKAKGVVNGEVEYTAVAICPLEETILRETGEKAKGFEILHNNQVVSAVGAVKKLPYTIFRTQSHTKNMLVWQDYVSPWSIRQYEYYEQIPEHIVRNIDEAYAEAVERARLKVAAKVGKESRLIAESIAVEEGASADIVQVRIKWKVLENIARSQLIAN